MRRWILFVVAGLVVLLAVGGLVAYRFMQRGMYEVGEARVVRAADAAPPSAAGDFVQVTDGVKLYHRVVGTGRPVIFVHGGPAMPSRDPWAAAELLGPELRIHFHDQRGSGRSTRPIDRVTEQNTYAAMQQVEAKLGLAQQIADVDRVRAAAGADRAVLIGHSFGGLIASLYAAEFPEHVDALILVAPAKLVKMPIEGDDLFARVRARLPETSRAEYDVLLKKTFALGEAIRLDEAALGALYDAFGRYFVEAAGPGPVTGAPAGATGGFATLATYLSLGMRHDYAPALTRVNVPVLVLHGKQDLIPPGDSDLFARYFPRAERRDIDGAGHFPMAEQPEAFAQAVREFLAHHRLLDQPTGQSSAVR